MKSNFVKYIGGGRWARTVLRELAEGNPDIIINWISKFNYKENEEFLKINNLKNVNLMTQNEEINFKYQKIFIASHSINHVKDLLNNIDQNVLIVCEKPLFCNIDYFKNLKFEFKKNTFINLEFFYSYFIEDFKIEINKISTINSIVINWYDSFIENRPNETKFSEIFSSIFLDQLLHVISILKALGFGAEKIKLNNIYISDKSKNGKLQINCNYNNILININISRFNLNRVREININQNQLKLDFANIPTIYSNKYGKKFIDRDERQMPVLRTISSFMNNSDTVEAKSHPLSILNLESELKFCFDCESVFVKNIFEIIERNNDKNCKEFLSNPIYAYFSGIIYYRKYSNHKNKSLIHYEKGFRGLNLLFKWMEEYLRNSKKIL